MHHRDEFYMNMTFELAKRGIGYVSPNPFVGALLIKNDRIISSGYHAQYGFAHAELHAIEKANESLEGATLYCNLEPCCHIAKQTPPCAQRIIKEKISRVVIANRDPNTHVDGKGIDMLRQAGIEVCEGILQKEGEHLNEIFFTSIVQKKPFVHLKWAQSLDGNIATAEGDSKWISNPAALQRVHLMRQQYDAVLVGQSTLLKDNPRLTIRLEQEERAPWRIVLTSLAVISCNYAIVTDKFSNKTIIVTAAQDFVRYHHTVCMLKKRGVRVEAVETDMHGALNLEQILSMLHSYNITSILVEGGSAILTSFIKQNLWDRASIFIAPMLLGNGLHVAGDLGIKRISDATRFSEITYETIEDTIHCNIKNRLSRRR